MSISYTGTRYAVPTSKNRHYTQAEIASARDYYADMWGIPTSIARAIVKQESGGRQYAKSSAGAMGVMQLMPKTAKSLGVTDSWDAEQNIWAGMKYLSSMKKQFGSWELALAAYNAGPGAVAKYKGIPPYTQTQNYVKNIMAMCPDQAFGANMYPVTYNFDSVVNKNKYINPNTGMLSTKEMNNFAYMVTNSTGYKGKVKRIFTNRPELLSDDPRYSDFKVYRDMKGSDGKPLFAKSDFNGMKVMVETDSNTLNSTVNKKGYNTLANEAIADDMAKHQCSVFDFNSRATTNALINTFGHRGIRKNEDSTLPYGLANLTEDEYIEYGVSDACTENPVIQGRILNHEYQRAKDVLGSDDMAIYAMAGGSFISDQDEIMTWREVKQDQARYMKRWFIEPSTDPEEREELNRLVSGFNMEYNKAGGERIS